VLGSEAIKPENFHEKNGMTYISVGQVLDLAHDAGVYTLLCDNALIGLQFFTDSLFRVKLSRTDTLDMTFGPMIEPGFSDLALDVVVEETDTTFTFRTARLQVLVDRKPFRLTVLDAQGRILNQDAAHGLGWTEKNATYCVKVNQGENFYGFGEKSGYLNKKGTRQTMWNTDVYAPHNEEISALYQSIPFFLGMKDETVYGLFLDNPGKTEFFLNEGDTYRFTAETGEMDYYFFYGPTMKDVISQYTSLTGRMPLPPKWAIGYHQSRYSYETDQEVRALAETFRSKEIPCDVIYLDIHYMDEYRVFTWHPTRFPNAKKLLADLREQGFRVVPIVDPGVKKDPKYIVYQEGITCDYFCKYIEGQLYTGQVWPGESAFPDFTERSVREWWGEKHQEFIALGIHGIWNDMNEPAIFNETKTMDLDVIHKNDGDPKTHGELHNLYGLYMSMATYEGLKKLLNGKRPFVLTRAGYAGIQKYAAVWTGDNRSFWEHLQMSIPMILNMGLSGIAFAGADVGGFAHDANAELTTRWTQVGAFLPYFRNHSAIGFARQEPWAFGQPYESIIKKYIDLRYHFLPHLYTLFHEASTTGLPVVRPLLLEYPADKRTANLNDQFLFGANILIAPILQPDTTHRAVYLPEGEWVNYETGETHAGGQHILAAADLDSMPIFLKSGTIYAGGSPIQHTGEQQEITFHVYRGDGTYTYYEDNGETFDYQTGAYNQLRLEQQTAGNTTTVTWHYIHQGYDGGLGDYLTFAFHHVDEPKTVAGATTRFDAATRTLYVSVPSSTGMLTVEFS
jgi:alpha-glucosidase